MRIIILMFYAALGYALYIFVRGYFSSLKGSSTTDASENTKMVECLECKAMVPVSHCKSMESDGQTQYFCSDKCLEASK